MPVSTNLEKNKLDLKVKDRDDIPFILCAPMKNENDDAAQAQDTTTDEAGSPSQMKDFIPQASSFIVSVRWLLYNNKKDVGPIAVAEMLSESSLGGMGKGSANESIDCNTWHSSPRSSPVPIFQSSFDVTVTPRVINLLKIRPRLRASQEEQQQEEDDDDRNASLMAGPLFPIVGRRDNRHLLQQQQEQHPVIQRPIPRHRR
jgi:hypothetical protein